MESNYTEAELNHNDQWDKWGRYKEMSNKDLTTCFNGNKHILSTRTSLRVCSGYPMMDSLSQKQRVSWA